jgi:ATP-dependent Lon protease
LPEGNKKDVAELPEPAKKGLKIFTHKHIDEIVKILFKDVKVAKSADQTKDERLKTKETQVEKPAKSVSKKS